MKLFPGLPKDLKAATNEDIEALIEAYTDVFLKLNERDEEVMGDLTMPEALNIARAAKDELAELRAELTLRAEVEETFESELTSIVSEAGVVSDDAETTETEVVEEIAAEVAAEAADEVVAEAEAATAEAADETETETASPLEAVAASARPAARPRLPRPSGVHTPPVADRQGTALVASAGLEGFSPAQELDRHQLAEAMIRKLRTRTAMPHGMRDDVVIASANYGDRFPDELRLKNDGSDTRKISDMIEARRRFAAGDDAVVASGGLCAPVTPYYELMNVAVADRPVRDALANFNAVRGGLQFAAPPVIGDVTGVGIKTAAQDEAGGTFATKTCQVVDCPEFSTVELSMVYHCLQFGNLNARAFPEMIADYNDLVMAAHARVAEAAILDAIGAASTAVTQAAVYGALATYLTGILEAAAGIRSRNRMRPSDRLRLLAPEWTPDWIASDLVNSQFVRFEYAREDITRLLERYGVNITWYYDGETGAGQVFSAQAAGVLSKFPTTNVSYLYPEGSFLFLDGGTLDLGIVRDSTLNSTNDFQIFGETFEATAFVGPEALKITTTACNDGSTGGPDTLYTC